VIQAKPRIILNKLLNLLKYMLNLDIITYLYNPHSGTLSDG
jgi:hypothetical protein